MTPPTNPGVKAVTALLTASPGKHAECLQTLEGLRAEIGKSPGCLECIVSQDTTGAARFIVFITWTDRKAMEAHLASEHFRILRGAADILSAPSEFRLVAGDAHTR
jgi:quinol monooxygenase YgiN